MDLLKTLSKVINIKQPGSLSSVLLSLTLSIGFYMKAFMRLSDCTLTNFNDRSIGIAIFSGVDAGNRTLLYILSIIFSLFISLFSFFIFSWINSFISYSIRRIYCLIEQRIIILLSSFSLLTIILGIITNNHFLISISKAFLLCSGFLYLYIFLKILAFKYNKLLFRFYNNYSIVIFGLIFLLILFFVKWVFFNGSFTFTLYHIIAYFILVFLFLLLYPFLINRMSINWDKTTKAHIIAGIPLVMIPLSIPLTNEINFTLSNFYSISPRTLSIFVISILIITSFFIVPFSFQFI